MKLQPMNDSILPLIESANKLFMEGPFGAGKTSLAIRRLTWLLGQERIRGSDILVLTPQRVLGKPYTSALRHPSIPPGPTVQVTTVASLARRSVELYWPLLSNKAGFSDPSSEPVFLNLETSQYHMGPLVDSALARGAFEGIRVERNRVISQILDNLNKAALNGFSIDDAYARLENSIPAGEYRAASLNALHSAQHVSHEFRSLCLDRNLVDYSLQIELFNQRVLGEEWSRIHLLRSCRHLVFDNLEEDTYTAHQLVKLWLPHLKSALLVADKDGGLRAFLGAAPDGAFRLRAKCEKIYLLEQSHAMSASMRKLERSSRRLLRVNGGHVTDVAGTDSGAEEDISDQTPPALYIPQTSFRFYPQMITWVAEQVQQLIHEGNVPAEDIVILAPYISDALRFGLQTELHARDVPVTTHRPSRPLRAEPAARSLLTLAALSHPQWQIVPSHADFAAMLSATVLGSDPVRSSLLASVVYRQRSGTSEMVPFEELIPSMQSRVTYRFGERYDRLRNWVYAYRVEPEVDSLDHFWSRVFGELLSQPGYAFHRDMDAARVAHQLVTSARNFRWAIESSKQSLDEHSLTGKEFYHLVENGAVGALFAAGWEERQDAVLIAPAYSFLMRNRPVGFQFWLDVGSSGWWERLYQPLTHPYVLSREWSATQLWSDLDEYHARQRSMRRLVLGLMRRARKRIYLGLTQYSESGYEQQGALLTFINRLLSEESIASGLVTYQ